MNPSECDVVMKGGITSGVIYPRLVAELSKRYTFRCIGGTSAGAIAAAATAAAQLGVKAGNASAFDELAKLPTELGARLPGTRRSMLLNLFQPQPALKGCFEILLACLAARSKLGLTLRVCITAVRRFPIAALLGAVPGAILFAQSWGAARWLSAVLVVVGLVLGALYGALRSLGRGLPRNQFGLCNGMGTARKSAEAALTPWLHRYLNGLAGKKSDEPLTFGELWAGTLRAPGQPGEIMAAGAPRVIELAMMTTALNLGRPFRIPFEPRDLYFVSEELAHLFPESVVAWMVKHARESATASKLTQPGKSFYALPAPADFPVIVAIRLSLSFPILLSALPLYTIDRSLKANRQAPSQATRIYFSDGGISSNFPVHFFDNPLPTRPTFGVNLRDFHPEHPGERVWLPELLRNNQGLKNHYPPISEEPGLGSVIGFMGAILATMQNWRDRVQLALPGFRDRIVHISHAPSEGGLNLDMPAATIETLANSGADAAKVLINAFRAGGKPEAPNAWDNHLRIRVRTFVAVLQSHLEAIKSAMTRKRDPSFDEVLLDPDPPSYRFPEAQAAVKAVGLLHELERLASDLEATDTDLRRDAPRPSPGLRVVPEV